MSEKAQAFISWVSLESGGRRTVPPGPSYVTVCRFEDDPNWDVASWSLVVEWRRVFREGKLLLADVHFLVPEAPTELLKSGNRFELFEGRKRVAKGIVLPSSIEVPEKVSDFEMALVG